MRINLVTPFAEKDAAKALGARWDAAKKCWYVVDVADLTPFSRWIPNMEAAMDNAPVNQFKGPTTGSMIEVPHCGCDVLPWEDCVHTAKS